MEHSEKTEKSVELATFYIGDALFGMDILKVQEINKLMEMTKIPQASEYVKGILNLRGKIITIIDLGVKLGLASSDISDHSRNIIVNSEGEYVGLLVDRIGDVVLTNFDKVEPPPANIRGIQGKFFEGVYKTDNNLIGILNMREALKEDQQQNEVLNA